uniref:GAT domain-containing protein n=1 Tax=Romanomermis culicivorax TaxID=13658 RepID=A0A915JYD8_ROMCU
MQQRLVVLLQQVANEEVTSELLMINDEMNNVFTKYDRYFQNRSSANNDVKKSDAALIDFNSTRPNDEINVSLGSAAQQKGAREPLQQSTTSHQADDTAKAPSNEENLFGL